MQKMIPALLLLLALGGTARGQKVEWKSVSPPGFTYLTTGIEFTSPTTGYATTYPSDIGGSQSILLSTTDQGETWAQTEFQGVELYDVKFADPNNGYMVGNESSCNCAVLYSTTNGGKNWSKSNYSSVGHLYAIYFMKDGKTGFITGTNSLILKTTDAGKNWSQITVTSEPDIQFRRINFPTPTVGYMTAATKSLGFANRIYKTTDGGANWTKIKDNGSDVTGSSVYSDINFTGADVGYLSGGSGVKMLWKTTDGGANWTQRYTTPGGNPYATMYRVLFLDDNIGYASGDDGLVLRTTNAGATWLKENAGATSALGAIKFIDANNGFVGGLFGGLFRRTAQLQPASTVSQEDLDFGTVASGTKELSLTLTAANEAGLRLDSLAIADLPGSPSGFSVVAPAGPFPMNLTTGSPLTITVRFTAGISAKTSVSSSLIIYSNDAANPAHYISLHADQSQQPQPAATQSATSLDFGIVTIPASKNLSLSLSPANSAGLRIDTFYIDNKGKGDQGFSIIGHEGPLVMTSVNDLLSIMVAYKPVDAGKAASADLVIQANTATPLLRVPLTGQGKSSSAGVTEKGSSLGELRAVAQPNPVAGSGMILIALPAPGRITVSLYDLLGRKVAEVFDGEQPAGRHAFGFDAARLPVSTYYCIVEAGGRRAVTPITVSR